jgi:N-acetylglutamate synthase-like GNAT family acetyltransferase
MFVQTSLRSACGAGRDDIVRGYHGDVSVRAATGSDAEAIQRLYRELVPSDRNIQVAPQRVEELRSDRHNRLLVLEADGQVCGTAFLTVCLDSMYGFQPFGLVENVIVASTHRGRGLGRLLMSAVEEQARSFGCTKLMLLSSAARVEAHSFFTRIGFDGEKKRGFVKYLNRRETSA